MTLAHETSPTGPGGAFAVSLQAMLPVIETARLRLRAPRVEDFAVYAEIMLSERGRFLFPEPNRRDVWLDYTQIVATWLLRGHGVWAVEKRADGDVVGFVLIGLEDGDHEPELGYFLRAGCEGEGYACEAAEAARDHAFETLGWDSVVSTIEHGNDRSVRLAERLGAQRDKAAEAAHGDRIHVYRHISEGKPG